MTKAATIETHRFLCLVAAAAMVIATLMALVVPRVAHAAEDEGITGSFTVGNEAPVITHAAMLYNSGHTGTVTQMTPQTQYEVKVTVADTGTIDDLKTVVATVFYDSNSDNSSSDIPSADTQVSFVMTCTVGGANGTWTQSPLHNDNTCTWEVISASCTQPPLTGGSGDFYFRFTPGKVATEAGDWDIYVVATDDSDQTDNYYDAGNYDMLWYGQIDVTTASVGWGSVTAGMNFDAAAAEEIVEATYVSNGDWNVRVATEGTWDGATLDADGSPAANYFSLKASSSDLADPLTQGTYVTTVPGACQIDDTGTITGETGSTNSANRLYLDLGTPFVDATYDGLITYYIVNG